jgi:bifunctional non-homologous end joining protein LigD
MPRTPGRKAPIPTRLEPQLADLVKQAPNGDRWAHEVKYDGYRMLARISRGEAHLISRHGRDWSKPFYRIAEAVAQLPVKSAWIDGEIVAVDAQGRISFQDLQNSVRTKTPCALFYFAFDVPYLNGFDLRDESLLTRKAELERITALAPQTVRYSSHIVGNGPDCFEEACKLKIEGIVSKRVDSRYMAGKTGCWLKTKCERCGRSWSLAGSLAAKTRAKASRLSCSAPTTRPAASSTRGKSKQDSAARPSVC